MKYCKRCKRMVEVKLIDPEDSGEKPADAWLKYLSPGQKVVGRSYRCHTCKSTIHDMSKYSIQIIPTIIIIFMFGSVAFFFFLVLSGII